MCNCDGIVSAFSARSNDDRTLSLGTDSVEQQRRMATVIRSVLVV